MRNQCLHLYLSLCISFFLGGISVAQSPSEKVKFSRIDVNSGLSNSNITSFLHDSDGFLWIGTRDGLNKYDGYDFKIYRNDQEDSTTLLKNHIYFLFEDSNKQIWVSTRGGGLHLYDKKLDRFKRIKEFSSYCVVAYITEDLNRNVWISGVRNEHAFAARLDRKTNTWKSYEIFPSVEPVTFLQHEKDNQFWVGIRRTGFYKWDLQSNKVEKYVSDPKDPQSISSGFLKAIADDQGHLWMSTAEGLSRFDRNTEKFVNFTVTNTKDQPALSIILDLCYDGRSIWMGTENGGLIALDTKNFKFRNFINDKNEPASLSDNSVWSVYRDHQGRIWVGTFSKGLCVIDNLREKFSELNIPLENDVVNAIRKDHKGRMWIGTEGGIVMKDEEGIHYFKNDPRKKGSLSNNPVLAIFEDHNNEMWFGTWTGGLNRYNENTKSFVSYMANDNIPHTIAANNVFAIAERSKTKQLLVSSFRGLNVMIDEKKGWFERHFDDKHPANNTISALYEDRENHLWVGSNAELNLYDVDTRKRKRYYVGSLHDSTTVGGYINCILEDSKGRLWVGASNGIHQIKGTEYVTRYSTKNGLPNNIVRGILEDNKGLLWLSTAQGLSAFNPKTGTFKNYDLGDGLLSNEFKPNACFKDKNGYLYFGGKGVIFFHPDSLKNNPHVPTVFITDVKLLNKSVKIGDNDSILTRAISETREISLDHQFNLFTINYVGLNFTASYKNQYAYKLEGFNDDWTFVGDQRSATFTNLDPGTYVFRVKASNNDGLWNETGTALTIHILPPWYETAWFKAAIALLVIVGAFGYYKLRVRAIQRRNRKLEKLVKERTRELQAREEEIRAQNFQLVEQRHELVTQNEELIGSQEEISAQRDLVALQNLELQKARAIIEEQNEKIMQRNETLEKEVEKRTKKIVEYNQQLEQFAFISAHNLRAPVARILGLGQVLELSKADDVEAKVVTDKIVHTTRELDRVVKDLNTILEIRKDNVLAVSEVSFEEELAMVKATLEKEVAENHARIAADFSACPKVQTVKPYLDSILINLVSNAIKYRDPDRLPVINISTSCEAGYVCLQVQDNGLGIDLQAYGDKLFVLYSRLHSHVEGKGMGLYLVKTQVTQLGGKIEVDSEPGKGTTFRIFLPANPDNGQIVNK
jgi:ligand-binding sensor domain-containing protein/signal transduction histidine kinase